MAQLPSVLFQTLKGHNAPLQVAKFNVDGRYCLTGGQDRLITLWNPYRSAPEDDGTGGLRLQTFRGHGWEVLDMAIVKDSSRFASVGGDKCAILWDVASGRVIRKLFGHEQRINSCAWNGDGTVLVTGSDDKTVRCWDTRAQPRGPSTSQAAVTGAASHAIQTMSDFRDAVTKVIVTPDNNSIISCGLDGCYREYDLRIGRSICYDVGAAAAAAAAVRPGGPAASASSATAAASSSSIGSKSPVSSMSLSNDGNCLLLAIPKDGGRLVLVERSSGLVLAVYQGHSNALYRLQPTFSSDDGHVICGSEDGSVFCWDLVEATVTQKLAAHKRVVSFIDYHPGGSAGLDGDHDGHACMLTASFDGSCRVWMGARADVRKLSGRTDGDDDGEEEIMKQQQQHQLQENPDGSGAGGYNYR